MACMRSTGKLLAAMLPWSSLAQECRSVLPSPKLALQCLQNQNLSQHIQDQAHNQLTSLCTAQYSRDLPWGPYGSNVGK